MPLHPDAVDAWTLETVTALVASGCYEPDTFDFKATLPDRRDDRKKRDLVADCCAFANSGGGFLIFGVADRSEGSAVDRLIGMDGTVDFGERFGNFPAQVRPSVSWRLRNPPLTLSATGSVVNVVQILGAGSRPHCVVGDDGALRFMKRTNKGNEVMSYEEVRMMFVGLHERQRKLRVLRAELEHVRGSCEVFAQKPEAGLWAKLELGLIEALLPDVVMLGVEGETDRLLRALHGLRVMASIVNRYAEFMAVAVTSERVPMSQLKVNPNLEKARELARQAILELDRIDARLDPMESGANPSRRGPLPT